MSSAIPGYGGEVYLSADGGATYNKIGEVTNVTLSVTSNQIDVTSLDSSGWMESISGLNSWTASADAFYIDGNASQEAAYAALAARNTMLFRFYSKNQSGKNKWEGTAFIETWELSQSKDAAVALKLTLKGTGALVKGDQ